MSVFSIPPVSSRPIFVPSETSSSTTSDSQSSTNPLANQSESSSTGGVLLKRRFSSDSNRKIFPESNLPAAPKKQKTSSTTAGTQPKSEIPDLPTFSKKWSYICIKKAKDLDQGPALLKKSGGRATFELIGIRCTAEIFKKLFKEVEHLQLNDVSFTKSDIPEKCDLAKFKSLYLSANLSGAAVVALLNKILPENLETLTLRLDKLLKTTQIAQLSDFSNLKNLLIDAIGPSGAGAVALINKASENLETLTLRLDQPLSADDIARLPKFLALKELVINAPGLSGAAIAALLNKISPEKSLETLNLEYCGPLSVEDIKAFPGFPALQTVYAHGVRFDSEEAKRAFQLKLNPNGLISIEM